MRVELHPAAERDLEEAAAFYATERILVVKHDRQRPEHGRSRR